MKLTQLSKKPELVKVELTDDETIKEYGEALEIQSPTDIKNLLAMTISGVWTGKIPANQPANTIGFLARCYLDACEISELEERLNKIESSISKNQFYGTMYILFLVISIDSFDPLSINAPFAGYNQ